MYLTREKMLTLSTPRLLAYKRKHLQKGFTFTSCGCRGCTCGSDEECPEFTKARETIKEILATREHVKG